MTVSHYVRDKNNKDSMMNYVFCFSVVSLPYLYSTVLYCLKFDDVYHTKSGERATNVKLSSGGSWEYHRDLFSSLFAIALHNFWRKSCFSTSSRI